MNENDFEKEMCVVKAGDLALVSNVWVFADMYDTRESVPIGESRAVERPAVNI